MKVYVHIHKYLEVSSVAQVNMSRAPSFRATMGLGEGRHLSHAEHGQKR